MDGWKRIVATCIGIAGVVGLTGCQDGREEQIRALQEDKARLENENDSMRQQLADSSNDAEAARQRALQLQQQLDDARRKLGQGSASNLPAGWEGTRTIAWTDLPEEILFDSGKAELTSNGRSTLRKLADTINSTPQFAGREVWIVGHTDTDPIKITKNLWKDNLDLSLNRAAACAREFWNLGFDKRRVTAAGQGEFAPRAANNTKDGKRMNRRVQIITVEKPDSNTMPTRGEAANQPG
ncbi:MAG: flagellar motor protein MotB [Phycisphaerae bacterium]